MEKAVKSCGGDWDKAYNEYLEKNEAYQETQEYRDPYEWVESPTDLVGAQ